jgi:rare lipoprotein A
MIRALILAAAVLAASPARADYTGTASWYSSGWLTASGERFNRHALTAASRTLPFGTRVLVTRRDDHRHVIVRINDRGPFRRGRVIDLSEAAGRRLGIARAGVAHVTIQVLR